ncbi:MAG TPA: hypothetical protein VF384_12570 [Planctomycetota bacterium]
MLADPESLLGRLQRGRGDAVRELLAMPRAAAGEVLLASLCTLGAEARLAHRELIGALAFDVTPWLRWLDALPATVDEDHMVFQWNLVGDLAVRGNRLCAEVLRGHVCNGVWWEHALGQYLRDGLSLDAAAWRVVAPRLDDEDLASYVYNLPAGPWLELAQTDARIARIVAADRERRDASAAELAWSPENYAAARRSQRRWRVLEDLLRRNATAAQPMIVDGLWDGDVAYRQRCIVHCDLEAPGVRARLRELATDPDTADAAQKRLGST